MFDAVCVGAHPDDVEIGMGATIASMADAGARVAIVDLTDGEPTPSGTRETRLAEAAQAARILGVAERRCLDLPNRYLFDTLEARRALAEVIRELRPRVLFVPYPRDAHPDHVAASQVSLAARFYAKLTKTDMAGEPHFPARVFHYMAVHLRLAVEPTFIVDAGATMSRKLEALRAYASQFGDATHNSGIITMMEGVGAHWGGMIRAAAGEPFFSDEPIGLRSPLDLT